MKIDDQLDEADRDIIRARDRYSDCIICGKPITHGNLVVCHFIKSSKSKYLKWDLSNKHGGHIICNNLEESDKTGQTHTMHGLNLLSRIGASEYARLCRDKNKESHFSKSDKIEMLKEKKRILLDYLF